MIGGVVMKVNNELVIKASKGDKNAFSDIIVYAYALFLNYCVIAGGIDIEAG